MVVPACDGVYACTMLCGAAGSGLLLCVWLLTPVFNLHPLPSTL